MSKKKAPTKTKTEPARPLTAAQLQSMGGKARMKMLNKRQRIDQARKAVEARWKRYREQQKAMVNPPPGKEVTE